LLAGALAATAALVAPVFAQTPATSTTSQAQPGQITAPEQPGEGEQGDGPLMHGRGDWGMHGGPMMQRMHRMMMRADPRGRCIDRLAGRAARRAYVETKLNLTAEQRPLWDKLQSIAQSEQQKEQQLCDQLKAGAASTMLERMDRTQQFLSARLDALQSAKPAVQALYQSLNPEQKAIFDHPFRRD